MQVLPNGTTPVFDTMATVPPFTMTAPSVIDFGPGSPFPVIVALVGLLLPYIFVIAVGVAVLIYLRRRRTSP